MSSDNANFDSIDSECAVYDNDELFQRGGETEFDDEIHTKYDVPEEQHLSFGGSDGDAPSVAGEVVGQTTHDQPMVGSNDAGVRAATTDAQVSDGVGGEMGPHAINHDRMTYVDGSRPAEINPKATATEGRSPGPSVEIIDVEGDNPAFGDILTIGNSDYVAIDHARAVKVPSGATLETIERIAGETLEALRHAELARSVTDGGVSRADALEIHEDAVERTRTCEVVDPVRRKVTTIDLAVRDQTEFEQREPARHPVVPAADMGPHKPFSLDFLQEPDHPTYLPQAGSRGQLNPCRWMDETADHDEFVSAAGEPNHAFDSPMARFARDADFAERVEDRVGAVLDKFETVGKAQNIDVFEAPGVNARSILETAAALLDAVDDGEMGGMAFADNIFECLFHKESQALSEIEDWWTGCTAVVRVEDFFVPRDPAKQEQVALVSDVNPFDENPNESEAPYAKLTVWSRGEPDVTLRKGDVVRVKNGKPGMYAGAFTLSAVWDTTMEIVKRGEGEAVTAGDAERTTDRIRGERVAPQDGTGAMRPDRPGFDEMGTGRVPLPRYRRPEAVSIMDMDFNDSGGVVAQSPGAEKYRSPTRLVDWHYPEWMYTDESVVREDQLVSDRILTSASLVDEDDFEAPVEFARFHQSAFENAIERTSEEAGVELAEREHPSIEAVYEGELGDDVVVRVYSTVVSEWAASTAKEIRVVARNTTTKETLAETTIARVAGSQRTRWDHALIDAVAEMVATLDIDDSSDDDHDAVYAEATDADVRAAVEAVEANARFETVEPATR